MTPWHGAVVRVVEGAGPVLLTMPHTSTVLPPEVQHRYLPRGLEMSDTDWWIDRLYDGLLKDATTVRFGVSRYVVDVNRDPSGESLYPGQATTELCPTTDFDGEPLYREGGAPDTAEIEARAASLHRPYHDAIREQIGRLRERHANVLLFDCHSIRSRIPRLFEGLLPVFNLGTDGGKTCAPSLEEVAVDCVRSHGSWVLNGRFRGGWTVRHHGRPEKGVHAVQLELAQRAYMNEEPPWTYDDTKAAALRGVLAELLAALESATRELAGAEPGDSP